MIPTPSTELLWMAFSVLAVGLMWLPDIGQLIAQEGLSAAAYDPARKAEHTAAWARRARRAHQNAVENIAVFAPLAIAVAMTGAGTKMTAIAAFVYFAARIGHFVVYVFAVPYLRVIFFAIGWGAILALAAALIGALL
ncbi:MAG: MAPEG family protein [Pseudomonadota bacterium]